MRIFTPTLRFPFSLALFVLVSAWLLVPSVARAYPGPNNVNGTAGSGYVTSNVLGGLSFGCNGCHFGTLNPPSNLSINGSGLGTFAVTNDQVANFTLSFNVGAGKPYGGFLVAHNDGTANNAGGTLGPGGDGFEHACNSADGFPCNGTSNGNTEVMHQSPRVNSGGVVSFPFTYSPVGGRCGTFTFDVWGNNVNGDSACDDSNDAALTGAFNVVVNCAASTDPCKSNSCNTSTGTCVTTLLTGNACNDGNGCSFNDTCTAGSCAGTPISCASDACNTRACNGSAACTVTPLSGGACDDGQSCTVNDVCTAGGCAGTPTGSCASGRPLGSSCTAASQCASTLCVDGTCCNNACSGQCQACNLAATKGTCSPVTGVPVAPRAACAGDGTACSGTCNGTNAAACTFPAASQVCRAPGCTNDVGSLAADCDGKGSCTQAKTQNCAPYVCGPTACDTACTANAECNTGNYCAAGKCVPLVKQAGVCTTDGQCGSGHCVDGVCCDTACTGQCEACNVGATVGTCSPVANAQPHAPKAACTSDGSTCGGSCDGTNRQACVYPGPAVECRASDCVNGMATVGARCTGNGKCPAAETLACGKDCVGKQCGNDCVASSQCNLNQFCLSGQCVPQRMAGSVCSDASECLSSFCVDGVCCNSACNGQCQACDSTDNPGACTAVSGVPHGERPGCAGAGQACGGACDGTKTTACTYPTFTKVCAAGKCTGAVATLARVCSGEGTCGPTQEQLCSPSPCGTTSCKGNCTTDANCTAGNYCSAGICRPKNPLGAPCAAPDQCTSNFCIDGLCCNSACDDECSACDNPLSTGVCAPAVGPPHGARPPCGGNGTCAGACDGKSTTSCVFPKQDTACGTPGCGEGVIATAPTCNGIGNCIASSDTADCYPYACTSDNPTCLTTCATNDDCSGGAVCASGSCINPLPDGGAFDGGIDAAAGGAGNAAGGTSGTAGTAGRTGAGGASGSAGRPSGQAGTPSLSTPDAGLPLDGGGLLADGGKSHGKASDSGCGCRVASDADGRTHRNALAVTLVALGLVLRRRTRRT
ncbi:MAG TPA: MYXO-CTERM sorting domain-containing protein [Polyangiaceae bacterium]|nr:MYXO-CTERM sorting domain-containing protein [Polyangiaceae bacterium]